MKKAVLFISPHFNKYGAKIYLIMRLGTFFILAAALQVSAKSYSQEKVTVHFEKTLLNKALKEVEKKSSFRFVYSNRLLNGQSEVTIQANNIPVEDLVRKLLQNTGLTFKVMDNHLVVLAKEDEVIQDIIVKGKVTDKSNGQPLPGVSIQVKGSSAGISTDSNGNYSLDVPVHTTLIFSFVGYDQVEVPVNGQKEINVSLQASTTGLNEVVVVGYGTQKKIDVTGAVDQISGKKLAERPIANIFQGLQGVSPGLNITYMGGQPGQTPTINVRGFASINDASGSPLVIIDGIPSTTDDLLRINPSDIGSITVLRDAASAAIYGARAAYGVLMVTTKQGGSGGRQSISYSNYAALSKPTVLPQPVTDPYIYLKVLDEATGNTPWHYRTFTPWQYEWAKQRSDNPLSALEVKENPDNPTKWAYMGNNDWNDYFFSKTSPSQYHSISFSGSSTDAKKMPVGYLLSADYTEENGLNKLAKDDWNRYGLRGRFNFNPLPWLKLDNNINVYQLKRDAPSTKITDIYYLQSIEVAKNPDGTWANTDAGILGAQLTSGGRNQQTRFGFQNVARAVASFFNNDLQITGDISVKRELWKYHTESLPYSIGYGPNDIRIQNPSGSITETNGIINQDVVDLFANYNKTFGDHAITLLAGYNEESYTWSPVTASKTQLISGSVPYIGLTTGDATVNNSSQGGYYAYAIRSYFGRLNYTYKSRYVIEANGRYDGSSRFPLSNRWGLFPSISGAWIASKEAFLSFLDPAISTVKFRASYGSLGNQSVAYFGYIQTLPVSQSSYLINGNSQTVLGAAPNLSVDPNNYTWEKVHTTNVGTDIGFMQDKIFASFDYYIRNTDGMLAPAQELPAVLGTSAPKQNSANLSTKGWEFSLNYRNMFSVASSPFSLNAKFILSDSKTKITKYNNALQTFSAAFRPGEEIGEIWGLTNDGYFQNADEIGKLDQSEIIPWGALDILAGWPKYKDLDGNGKIELGPSAKDPKDLSVIGNSSPRYRFGFNLDAAWKGIDFSIFLQGIAKMDFYPHHYLFWGPYQQPYANVYPWNLDYYRATSQTPAEKAANSRAYNNAGLADANTNSYFPVLQSWLADNNYGTGLDIPQTKYLLNASYLRIKNITLGYSLPPSAIQRFGIKRLRFFLSGENIFEFSTIKKYLDP
ncbi:MAG: TonB-dependent receptor [Ginsengibacter sp.]